MQQNRKSNCIQNKVKKLIMQCFKNANYLNASGGRVEQLCSGLKTMHYGHKVA